MSAGRARAVSWFAGLSLVMLAGRARAEDARDEQGFADAAPASAVPHASAPGGGEESAPSPLHLSASVSVQGALRLERGGVYRWSTLRVTFAPRVEYKRDFARGAGALRLVASGRAEADFAYLLRRDAYDAPTMELYGAQLIPGETYLGFASRHVELSFGEQIVNYGQGEVLTLLDVVNPRDLREPLFADLEQLRLPVLMTRAALALEPVRAEVLLVHEPSFGLLPPPAGEFSPLRRYMDEQPVVGGLLRQRELRYRHVPGRDPSELGALQVHGRLALRVARADLALQAASVLDAQGVPVVPSPRELLVRRVDLVTYHPRYTLLGQAGTVSAGPLLLRWELSAALHRPLIVRATEGVVPALASERLSTVGALLGVTYVPTGRTNLALELAQTGVIDHPERRAGAARALLFPVEATQLALRVSHQFLRDKAAFTLVAVCIGLSPFNAFAGRVELSYAPRDGLRVALGAVSYQPSQRFGPFYGFERNDRVYAAVRWSFAAD